MPEIALALGGNVGETATVLRAAARDLSASLDLAEVSLSSLYTTVPWGKVDQANFVNAVLVGTTQVSPLDVLSICLSVEARHGRERTLRWGPRTLDVDIIYYGDTDWNDGRLKLPHPLALERAFVLVPLLEIRPGAVISGTSCVSALERLPRQTKDVVLLER